MFALLPNKTEVTYTRFYQEVFNRIDGDGREDILIDFERSALNAFNNVKPQVEKKGCFYHFCANVWKHIQNFGLQHLYNMNQEFAINLRMLCALAFIPPPEVTNGFDTVRGLIRNNFRDEADDVLDYFEDTYVGRFRHNAPRRNPRFSIEFWNMFNRADQELPRANNSIEGWHRSFVFLSSNFLEVSPYFKERGGVCKSFNLTTSRWSSRTSSKKALRGLQCQNFENFG